MRARYGVASPVASMGDYHVSMGFTTPRIRAAVLVEAPIDGTARVTSGPAEAHIARPAWRVAA